jgi:hypothetical protein
MNEKEEAKEEGCSPNGNETMPSRKQHGLSLLPE